MTSQSNATRTQAINDMLQYCAGASPRKRGLLVYSHTITDTIVVPDGVVLEWSVGPYGIQPLVKGFNGDMVTLGNGSQLVNAHLNGAGGTYTGRGIVIPAGADQVLYEPVVTLTEGYCLEFPNGGGGIRFKCYGGKFTRQSLTDYAIGMPASELSTTGFRHFFATHGGGGYLFDFKAGNYTTVTEGASSGVKFSASSQRVIMKGFRLADSAAVIHGNQHVFDGCAFSGSVTFDSDSIGCKFGLTNLYSSVTDNGTGNVIAEHEHAAPRERLTANRTYYVLTTGDDANTGLANNSGGAFATIQKAIDTAAALDLSIYSVTINVGAGTYTAGNTLKSFVGAGAITIRGDTTTPSNVIINPTGAACFSADGVVGIYNIWGMKLQTTTSGNCVTAANGSIVRVAFVEFGAVSAGNYHMKAETNASIRVDSNYSITGGAFAHMGAETGGLIVNVNRTVTLTGTFAFHASSGGFAYAGLTGGIYSNNTWNISGATVTGKRYNVQMNAWVNTLGAGVNFFPGDVAGTTATGGQYQ